MGYESRIYFVEKSRIPEGKHEKRYASIIAMFDASKFPSLAKCFKRETDCYIYSDDGNTKILLDRYDAPLKELPAIDLLNRLSLMSESEKIYRRWEPLYKLTHSLCGADWDNIYALHFGY